MLYQRKRKKINLNQNNIKKSQGSTHISQQATSIQKRSSNSQTKKKSLTKIFNKRIFDKGEFGYSNVKQNQFDRVDQEIVKDNSNANPQIMNTGQTIKANSLQDLQSISDNKSKDITNYNTISISSIKLNNPDQELQEKHSNRKKFKLYCQLKKKKQNPKKIQNQKQAENNYALSTASQSFMKNSFFSKTSEQSDSIYTQKSRDKRNANSKRKINLAQKIKQIKSKQKMQELQSPQKYKIDKYENKEKQHFQIEEKSSLANLKLQLKNSEAFINQNELSSKRSKNSKNSLEKKQSTVNIKRSKILQKISNQRSNKLKQNQHQKCEYKNENFSSIQKSDTKKKSQRQSAKSQRQTAKQQRQTGKQQRNQKRISRFQIIENKILPQDSEIAYETVKKLSQIKEQRNEETISRSIKGNELNSVDCSNSKNNEQTLMHLSINSICHRRQSFNCILQTTEMRQSALRKQIQSSLSQIQKTRQKINIQKFKEPKTIGQMGSEISTVQQNMTVIQKIEFHIELINTLSNFVYKSTQLQYLMEDWDQLNFLIYKKFYIQRTKVLHFLKKYPIKNPFCIKRASIQTKQILNTLRQHQREIKRIKQNLEKQNQIIKKNLNVFFAQFDNQKQGEKINLLEYDNFSHWIYKELWDEIQLFSYSQSHNQLQLQDRICKSLQTGFLISELNGNYVTPFQDAQIASHQKKQKVYIDDNLKIFERYVLNKKK